MIRKGKVEDIPQLVKLNRMFANELPDSFIRDNFNMKTIGALYYEIIDKGVCYVYSDVSEVHGVIAGAVSKNIWNPYIIQLDEVIFYIHPDHRRRSIGTDLLDEYTNAAKNYKLSTLKLMHNSPDMEEYYNNLGYNYLERTYVRGG